MIAPPLGLLLVIMVVIFLLIASSASARRKRTAHSLFESTTCPVCGTNQPPHARFCRQCGRQLPHRH